MEFEIYLTHDPSEIIKIKNEWRELQARSNAKGITLTWDWVSTWVRHFNRYGQVWLLLAREKKSQRLVGIAPFFKTKIRLKYSLPFQLLEFIGAKTRNENLDFIIESGMEHRIIPLFLDEINAHSDEWDLLRISQINNPDLYATVMDWSPHWKPYPKRDLISPSITLPETTDDWMMHSISKNQRKKLRRHRRRLDQDYPGNWFVKMVSEPQELDEVFPHLVELHQSQWEAVGKPGAFYRGQYTQYYLDLMRSFLNNGWLKMFYLVIEEELKAVLFGYHYRGIAYDHISGRVLDDFRVPIGHVLTHYSIEHAIQQGNREYRFLWGDEDYKYSFGAEERVLRTYELASSAWLKSQFRFVDGLKQIKATVVPRGEITPA